MLLACYSHKHISYRIRTIIRKAIHYAAENGYTQVVEVLLEEGADVNAQDKDGRTPLYYAVYYTHGEHPRLNYQHPKVAKLL